MKEANCLLCWEVCDTMHDEQDSWIGTCQDESLCLPGCLHACRFYNYGQQGDPNGKSYNHEIRIQKMNFRPWPLKEIEE